MRPRSKAWMRMTDGSLQSFNHVISITTENGELTITGRTFSVRFAAGQWAYVREEPENGAVV